MHGYLERGSNSRGARPVHIIIKMIKWIRTSRLSIKNSLSLWCRCAHQTGTSEHVTAYEADKR